MPAAITRFILIIAFFQSLGSMFEIYPLQYSIMNKFYYIQTF